MSTNSVISNTLFFNGNKGGFMYDKEIWQIFL